MPAAPGRTKCARGMNKPFVTNEAGVTDHLVPDHSGFGREADTYELAV